MDDLSGDKTRLEQLQDKVAESKRRLKYHEELLTHEICLQNGKIYPMQEVKDD